MTLFTEQNIRTWQSDHGPMYKIICDREDLASFPMWYHLKGLIQTDTGYGRKLTTEYKINFNGRLYRIYCTLMGNSGSMWFVTKGRKIFVG